MPEGEGEQQQGGEPKTFTQEQVNSFLADQKRKQSAQFADYDDLKAKATQFDELTAAQKTALQRATDQAAAAETAKAAAEKLASDRAIEILRFQVAAAKGITGDDLVLLTGADKDALEKQADRIAALNKGQRIDPGQGRGGHAETGSAGAAEARRRFGDGTK